jgi:hypothetical protein
MNSPESAMTEAEKAQFVLGVYFRTQAAIEKYLGTDGLPAWTDQVASINSAAMLKRVPDPAERARDLLTGLATMLAVYGSDTVRTDEPRTTTLAVRRCGIYDYRERAQAQGVELTLRRPCEYCVDLHHRTADKLDIAVEHELGERSCHWTVRVPDTEQGEDLP